MHEKNLVHRLMCGSKFFGILFIFLFILQAKAVVAQTDSVKSVQGVVTDENGVKLSGVTIHIVGTNKNQVSDSNGDFEISVTTGDKIEFTYVGKVSKTISYNNEPVLSIILITDNNGTMEDVVVTGYQSVRKKLFAGSSATLAAKDVERAGMPDISRMLEGQFAGVSLQNVSGTFGAAPKLRIRGATSLSGDNKPLWVIDGVIVEDVVNISNEALSTGDMNTLLGSSVAGVNPSDIEDITILRDAAATALYGARAMNGVVVVTTKKGRQTTKPIINYTGNFSMYLKPNYSEFDILSSSDQMGVMMELMNKGYYQMPETINGPNGGVIQKMYKLINTYDSTNGAYGLRNDAASRNAFLQRYANANTDWFDIIFKNALLQEHSLSVSTGTDKFQTYASTSYLKDEGQAIGNNVERYTGNFRLNFKMSNKFRAELLSSGSVRNQRAPGTELRVSEPVFGTFLRGFDINPYKYALNTSRMVTPYDENGNLEYFTQNYAPFNIINELNTNYMKMNVIDYKVQGSVKYKIIPSLEYTATGQYRYVKSEQQTHILENSNKVQAYRAAYNATTIGSNEYLYSDPDNPNGLPMVVLPDGGFYNISADNMKYFYFRQDLEFNKTFNNDHAVSAFASMEARSTERQNEYFDGVGYQYENGGLATPFYMYFKKQREQGRAYFGMQPGFDRFLAYMGTATYGYKNKYIITPTVRYDGSNKMGRSKTARWLPTWNVAGKWNVTEESFWPQNKYLTSVVLRGSYGLTANIGSATNSAAVFYNQIARRPYINDQEVLTYINSLENSELTWEKSRDLNIGTDFGFFNSRATLQVDYYVRRMFDLIGSVETSGIGGQATKVGNYGRMRGNGIEFTLSSGIVKTKNFDWNTRLNLSINKNKIYYLETTPRIFDGVSPNGGAVQGYPQRGLFSVEFAGLNPYFGYPTFIGIGESRPTVPQINLQDDDFMNLIYNGPVDPITTGGFYNSVRYRNFTLSGLLKFAWGNALRLNPTIAAAYSDQTSMTRDILNRWLMPGDEAKTNIPALIDGVTATQIVNSSGGQVSAVYPYNLYNYSDVRVAKGDYLKLSNIMLSYQLPKSLTSRLGMTNASLSAVANNLWVIYADEKLNGQDPEFFNSGGVALPSARQVTLSLKLGF